MGAFGSFQKPFLLVYSQKVDVINRPDRFRIANTIHRMTVDEAIIFGTLEKCAHGHIGLTDGRTSIVALHGVQNPLTVDLLDIAQQHRTDEWLDVVLVSLTIIPNSVRSTVANDIPDPLIEPCVHRHIGRCHSPTFRV